MAFGSGWSRFKLCPRRASKVAGTLLDNKSCFKLRVEYCRGIAIFERGDEYLNRIF